MNFKAKSEFLRLVTEKQGRWDPLTALKVGGCFFLLFSVFVLLNFSVFRFQCLTGQDAGRFLTWLNPTRQILIIFLLVPADDQNIKSDER